MQWFNSMSYSDQECDAQGRVLLPALLRQKVGMERAICFVGIGRYLEIWDEARFAKVCAQSEENIEDLMSYVNDRYYSPSEG